MDNKMLYNLEERPPGRVLWLSTLQWFIFTIGNVVTIPLVLGNSFGLSDHATAMLTSRTMFVCGLIGLLQALIGHRFAIIEGPAGMWWGVFLILLQLSHDSGTTTDILLRELEWGLMAGAMVFILLAVTGLIGKVRSLYTPAITGTFLVILSVQVSKSLMEGMLGIGYQGTATVKPFIALISLLLVVLTVGLARKGKGLVQNISVLISMLAGWVLYAVLGMLPAVSFSPDIVALPQVLPFGRPVFDWGVVITCAFTSLIVLSNLISSIQVFASTTGMPATGRTYGRGSLLTGVGTFCAGLFGTVAAIPITAAASLVALTGIASRLPFVLCTAILALLGLFPAAGQLLATIPAPVGCAVLFTVFAQLVGFGLRDFKSLALDQRDIFIVGFAFVVGSGSLFIPGKAWENLPPLFGFILGNGLIIGVLIALVLEHLVFRKPKPSADGQAAH